MNHGASQGPTRRAMVKELLRERIVEVPVYVERVVEVPVEKIVEVEKIIKVPVEKEVVKYVEKVVKTTYVPGFWEYVGILLKRLRDVF